MVEKPPSTRATIAARILVGVGVTVGVGFVARKVAKATGAPMVLVGLLAGAVGVAAHERLDAPVARFLSDQGL